MLTLFRRAAVRRSLWAAYTLVAMLGLLHRAMEQHTREPYRRKASVSPTAPPTPPSSFNAVPLRQPWTLLRTAAAAGDTEALRRLLEKGAEPDGIAPFAPLPYTPLTIACQNGHVAAAVVLLDHGADPNAGPRTPLMAAVASDTAPELIDLLISRGARPNVRCQEAAYAGWTALDFAAVVSPTSRRNALKRQLSCFRATPPTPSHSAP